MHEVVHVDDQVFDDWKVGEGFHLDRPTFELVEKASAGELRDPVHIRAAATADPIFHRPPKVQVPAKFALNMFKGLRTTNVFRLGTFVSLQEGFAIFLRTITRYPYRCNILAH